MAAIAMLRVVLDSSVLVSAFLTPRGVCADLLRAADGGAFALQLSPEILAEVASTLSSKPKLRARYGYGDEEIEAFCDDLAASAELVTDLPALRVVPGDPKDDPVVATAVAVKADHLITGDRRHLIPLGTYEGIRIMLPRDFLDLLRQAPD
jgi:putative PIN family toxin of toxin-antitoxin system